MLGTTLWLLAALALLATGLLDAGAALARGAVHAAAAHAIESAMHDALADYQNRLGAAIARGGVAAGGDPYASAVASLPNPLTLTRSDAASSFAVAYAVVPTTVSAPRCGAPAAGPDEIAWLQCNAFVSESRISLRITVRVLDARGAALLAQRDAFVTLRLFDEPPYSAVVGRKDAGAADPIGADALRAPAHEGDAGGDTAGAAPSSAAGPWPSGGTLIHVRFECHDGAGSCANAAPPDPDAALQRGARWQNGNAPSP